MAPILIDNRGLKKLAFIAVLTTVFTFAGGFLFGYQQATVFYAAGSESEPLSLPMKNVSVGSDIEQQAPEIVDAGEKIDVDQPGVDQSGIAIAQTKLIKKIDAEIKQQGIKQGKLTTQVSISSVDEKPLAVIESINASNTSNENIQTVNSGSAIDKTSGMVTSIKVNNQTSLSATVKQATQQVQATLIATDELKKVKYSIQVGVYGRLINAQKMTGMLQVQDLDAYVSDYVNKKNKVRYNVRFGYFVDKKMAMTALKEYRNIQKGDGYLVNFSDENIINFAAAGDSEHIDKESTSVTGSIDQDKVSQVDIIKTSNVLTKSQHRTLVTHLLSKE